MWKCLAALFVTLAAAAAGACANGAVERPAILASADDESIAALKAVLAEAMGRARVEFGAGDPSEVSTLSVLPRVPSAYETNSPATPALFDIRLRGGRCYAVRRETGEAFELKGLVCRALEN